MDKKEFFFSWLVLLALSLFGENVAAQKKENGCHGKMGGWSFRKRGVI